MPSLSSKTKVIRKRKSRKAGKKKKIARTKAASPKFPIHQDAAK